MSWWTGSRLKPTFSGDVCLSSPTMIDFRASASIGNVNKPHCEASSTISTSKGGSMPGLNDRITVLTGITQTGTASFARSIASFATDCQWPAYLPVPLPTFLCALIHSTSAWRFESVNCIESCSHADRATIRSTVRCRSRVSSAERAWSSFAPGRRWSASSQQSRRRHSHACSKRSGSPQPSPRSPLRRAANAGAAAARRVCSSSRRRTSGAMPRRRAASPEISV